MSEKIRIPRQQRGIKTKQRLIDVAIKIFSEKGYYNTSSNEISEHAGLSIGCFYSYFKNKKQLFLEALNYYNYQINKGLRDNVIIEHADRDLLLSEFIRSVFKAHKICPQFHNEVIVMSILDSDIKKIVYEEEKFELNYVYKLLELWKDDIKVNDLETAAFIIYNLIQKNTHTFMFFETKIKEEYLIKELVEIILKYLF